MEKFEQVAKEVKPSDLYNYQRYVEFGRRLEKDPKLRSKLEDGSVVLDSTAAELVRDIGKN